MIVKIGCEMLKYVVKIVTRSGFNCHFGFLICKIALNCPWMMLEDNHYNWQASCVLHLSCWILDRK